MRCARLGGGGALDLRYYRHRHVGFSRLPNRLQADSERTKGTGDRVFCAGQDLKGWLTTSRENKVPQGERIANNRHGFGSIARRRSKKTLICALNGHAFGGGAELLFNCDIIIGFDGGIVCFPEVRRGQSVISLYRTRVLIR